MSKSNILDSKSIAAKNRKQKHKQARIAWQLYLFLLIPVIYTIVFNYYPMLGLQIAFKDFKPALGIWGSEWAGFKHFVAFFNSYQFTRVVGNTLYLSFYSLIASFPMPIIFALLLNTVLHSKYKSFIQTITYIPHFISTVVLVGMMLQMFNPYLGIYGKLYKLFNDVAQAPDIIGKASTFPHMYVWSAIWQSTGFSTIIYVAALSAINPELHEAAEIDGASRFKRVIHIDFPVVIPTATIMLILNAGRIMSIGFEKVYLMQNDLNLRSSEVISTYVYKVGLAAGGGDFGYATAIGLFNSVINLIMIIAVNKAANKLSSSSLW